MSPTYEASPVPSDAHLWPGELPFTAFGQFGVDRLDLRVYLQDIWWVDRLGVPHRINEMSFEYRANVIMFLREQADSHHLAMTLRAAAQLAGDALLGFDTTDDDPRKILEMGARAWQDATPLMRRLIALTGVDGD